MKNEIRLSKSQNIVFVVAGTGAVIGIYVFLSTQVDTSEPFVIGAYLVICAVTVWALRRFVASNVDQHGHLISRRKH